MPGKDSYSRLWRARSKTNVKSPDSPGITSSPTIDRNTPRSSVKSPSKNDSLLSLPLSVSSKETSTLADDSGISQFLATDEASSSKPNDRAAPSAFASIGNGPHTPNTGPPRLAAAGLKSSPATLDQTLDGSPGKRSRAESMVSDLRESVFREMKEKEALLNRYESLSRKHLELEKQVSKIDEEPDHHDDRERLSRDHAALQREHARLKDTMANMEQEAANGSAVQDNEQAKAGSAEDTDGYSERLATAHTLIKNHEEQNARLRKQNLQLQQGGARAGDGHHSSREEELCTDMDGLAFDIQNWILNNFRKYKLDLSNLDEETEKTVETAVPRWKAAAGIAKNAFLQALASAILCGVFNDEFFVGLPQHGKFESLLSAFNSMKSSSQAFFSWRASTVTFLSSLDDEDVSDSIAALTRELSEQVDGLLCLVTEADASSDRQEDLQRVAARAVYIAHAWRSQRAQYNFSFPPNSADRPTMFDPRMMDDIRAEEADSQKKTVQMATFPSVTKLELGPGSEKPQSRVIMKAKVWCGSKYGT